LIKGIIVLITGFVILVTAIVSIAIFSGLLSLTWEELQPDIAKLIIFMISFASISVPLLNEWIDVVLALMWSDD